MSAAGDRLAVLEPQRVLEQHLERVREPGDVEPLLQRVEAEDLVLASRYVQRGLGGEGVVMTPIYYPPRPIPCGVLARLTCCSETLCVSAAHACRPAPRRSCRRPWSPCCPRPAPRAPAHWRRSPRGARVRSGAIETSARSRSIARTIPAPTSAGDEVPVSPGAAAFGVGEHAGVADDARASLRRRRRRCRAGPRAGRGRSRGGRTWSRSTATPGRSPPCPRATRRRRGGPRRDSMQRRDEPPSNADRRLEVDAQRPLDLAPAEKPSSAPRGRQRRVGDEHVESPAAASRRSALPLLGEVGDTPTRWPPPGSDAARPLELVALAAS